MKIIQSIRKVASTLIMFGIIAIVLTIIQPMHPKVDSMFQIGGGITIALCIGTLVALSAIEKKIISKQKPSKELRDLK